MCNIEGERFSDCLCCRERMRLTGQKVIYCEKAFKHRPIVACAGWADRPISPNVPTYRWEEKCPRCQRSGRKAESQANPSQPQQPVPQQQPLTPPLPQTAVESQLTAFDPKVADEPSQRYGGSDPRQFSLDDPKFDPRTGRQIRAPSTYSDPDTGQIRLPNLDPGTGGQMRAPSTYRGSDPSNYKF